MPHNTEARAEAGARPLVLFGEHGRTVEGYRPADEDLEAAKPARNHKAGGGLRGPHVRVARQKHPRNKTGVVGISEGFDRTKGRSYFYVNLGTSQRNFCIDTLGRAEAWRRATHLRHEHLRKIAQANTVILKARSRYGFVDQEGAS